MQQLVCKIPAIAVAVRRLLLMSSPQLAAPSCQVGKSAVLPILMGVLLHPLHHAEHSMKSQAGFGAANGQLPSQPQCLAETDTAASKQNFAKSESIKLRKSQPNARHPAITPLGTVMSAHPSGSILPLDSVSLPGQPRTLWTCARLVASHIFTVPRLDQQVDTVSRQLTDLTVLRPCMFMLQCGLKPMQPQSSCNSTRSHAPSGKHADSKLDAAGCLAAVGNLSALLAGPRTGKICQVWQHCDQLLVDSCCSKYFAGCIMGSPLNCDVGAGWAQIGISAVVQASSRCAVC